MHVTTIEFGSLLTYSPRGISEHEQRSKTTMQRLKNDEPGSNPPILMSDFISRVVKERMTTLPFAEFFKINPILVPIPNSSWMQVGTLWVPQRLANALIQNGLGKAAVECLKRVQPLPKSATSSAKDRPKAAQHFNSLEVQTIIPEPREILLIDDVITRGATLLGAANRLRDAFPGARIQAFAAMRTISPPDIFNAIYDPCKGDITLNDQDTFRRP
jgi:predicted amidophosphoribosyltransferase